MSGSYDLIAPAKINLYLHITSKRDDGYHTLESLVDFVDVGDGLSISPADDFALLVTGEYAKQMLFLCPNQDDNLVIKSAKYIKKYIEESKLNSSKLSCANITINKVLPVSSGIGGGSSDGATAMLLLLQMWHKLGEISLSPQEIIDNLCMNDIAKKLGADVPMCLYREPLIAKGIGEEITIIKPRLPAIYYVLVNPNISVSTAEIFGKLKTTNHQEINNKINIDIYQNDSNYISNYLANNTNNDLEYLAQKQVPIIAECLEELRKTNDNLMVRMSGSGATCFATYHNEISAKNAAETIKQQFPDWWVASGKSFQGAT